MQKEFGVLNVVAQPHPPGVYLDILRKAADLDGGTNFFGDLFARISPPGAHQGGIYRGRIAIWTEINPSEPAIYKSTLEQTPLDQTNFRVPHDIGFNSKVFYYAFRESDHLMFIELRNDNGGSVSINRVAHALKAILSNVAIDGIDSIEVHVKTETDAVSRVRTHKSA